MPRMIEDDSDDSPRTGGGEIAEARALMDGNMEPDTESDMSHPDYPSNCCFKIGSKWYLGAIDTIDWFRSVYPDWTILVEELETTPKSSRVRCTILDTLGRVRSQGTKSWSMSKNAMFHECAESSAIARAIRHCGFTATRARSGIPFKK